MPNSVEVSIIFPCFNSSNTISQSIHSVLNQTYENWELIIIDDFSYDNTFNIINEFATKDHRIVVIKNNRNMGVAFTRNTGIDRASGKFISFLDSDDYWSKNKLEVQLGIMIKNNYNLTFTSYYRVDINDKIISKVSIYQKNIGFSDLLKGNVIALSSSMICSDIVKKFSFKKVGHEDYLFWLNILQKPIIGYSINSFLTYYRVHHNSLSGNKLKAVRYTWNIYRNHLKFSYLKSLYYFVIHIYNSIKKRF